MGGWHVVVAGDKDCQRMVVGDRQDEFGILHAPVAQFADAYRIPTAALQRAGKPLVQVFVDDEASHEISYAACSYRITASYHRTASTISERSSS
jgi:hypothetical protein